MEPNVNHLDTDTGSMSMEIQQKLLQHSNGWTLIALQLLNVKKSGEFKLSDHDNNAPTPMVSLLAWETLAVHCPPKKMANKNFW